MSEIAAPPAAHGVRPRQPAPALRVALLSGGTYALAEQKSGRFTMVVFFPRPALPGLPRAVARARPAA